jgi:hypothetical protein
MDALNYDTLRTLCEAAKDPCVSIYQPTHRAMPEVQQDPIRFKNLLSAAEGRLRERGLSPEGVREFLSAAAELLEAPFFWEYQSDGLATFIAPGFFKVFRLPLSFDETVVVGEKFHVKPLLALFTGDGRFFVLALSAKEARLLQGSRYSVAELAVEGLPEGMEKALGYDALQKQLQFHTGAPGRGGGRDARFHGHGAPDDDAKDNIGRYFRRVDEAVRGVLAGERAPLVLAAVDYLHPIYRDANTYGGLYERGVEGNPDELSAEELHRKAWELVAPAFQKPQEEAASRYHALRGRGSGLASDDVSAVAAAAHHGRVETLFVAVGVQRWGAFDPASGSAVEHETRRAGDEDLLDLAAVETLTKGGAVYIVEAGAVPGGGDVAAILRY